VKSDRKLAPVKTYPPLNVRQWLKKPTCSATMPITEFLLQSMVAKERDEVKIPGFPFVWSGSRCIDQSSEAGQLSEEA